MLNALTRTRCAATALVIAGFAAPATAAECGDLDTVTIAEMTWQSAAMVARVAETVLAEGYGCDVEIVPGDTVPTATSLLTRGEPMIAPELWLSTVRDVWTKIEERGTAYAAGPVFADGGLEGWHIPRYLAEAEPDLKSIFDVEGHRDLFVEAQSDGKGRIYSCPPGWQCETVNANIFRALALEDKGFELFSPGSGANLDASIARKATRKEPFLAYYWAPTALVGKYDLVRLDMGEYNSEAFDCLSDPDCPDPQIAGWRGAEIVVAVVPEVKEKAPDIAAFLARYTYPNAVVNAALAWAEDNSASGEEMAAHFLETYPEIWRAWVPDEAAEKIAASL